MTLAYLGGAEPGLSPERIRIAQKYIPYGVVFTNGTIRLPDDIRYRIHISSWGLGSVGKALRDGDVLSKALANYRDDPRAVCVFTISALNLDQIVSMAEIAADHGLPLTFNCFSPTVRYLGKLEQEGVAESSYFRIASKTTSPVMSREHFEIARREIKRAMERFPTVVRYSIDYDKWISSESIYDIDSATGIARDCGVRLTGQHHYHVDQTKSDGKCCCRISTAGLAGHMQWDR